MSPSSAVEVVIVGAGAAGLAAGRTAQSLGLRFVVLEALDRIGGRAYTNTEPFGLPWDLGCHWLHSADVNPLRALADEYGFRSRSAEVAWRWRLGNRWATDQERGATWPLVEDAFAAVKAAGDAGRDQPLSEVVDLSDPWQMLFESVVRAKWGMDLDQVSTLDYVRYRDTANNCRSRMDTAHWWLATRSVCRSCCQRRWTSSTGRGDVLGSKRQEGRSRRIR